MRSKDDREDYRYSEEDGQSTIAMIISGAVLLIIIAVLCAMIWKLFHTETDIPVKNTDQSALETVTDTLVGNDSKGDTPSRSGDGEGSSQPQENEQQEEPDQSGAEAGGDLGMIFKETDDLVTAKEVTNLRSEPSTDRDDTVVMQLKNGDTIKRTGINEEMGWSRLEHDGQVLYAATRLLMKVLSSDGNGQDSGVQANDGSDVQTEPDAEDTVTTSSGRVITFTDCDDTVSAKIAANLRGEPSSDQGNASIHHQLMYGETAHRTGYDEASGWSRVEYKGEVLYVVTSLIYVIEETEE